MGLADYVVVKRPVMYRGKMLVEVRGLNFEDVSVLVRNHLADLNTVFSAFADSGKSLPALDIEGLIFSLVTNAPDTAAKAIAIACDEPFETDKARSLVLPLQMKILIEVVRLTFEDFGGPLVLIGLVRQHVLASLAGLRGVVIPTDPLSNNTATFGTA